MKQPRLGEAELPVNMSSVFKSLRTHWKWGLLFILLPTLNGCEPSIGYPFSIGLTGYVPNNLGFSSHQLVYPLLIFTVFNVLVFLLSIKVLARYFSHQILHLRVFLVLVMYEALLTLASVITLYLPLDFSFRFGQFTLSWWLFLGLWSGLGFGDSGPSPGSFEYQGLKLVAIIAWTIILFIISWLVSRIALRIWKQKTS